MRSHAPRPAGPYLKETPIVNVRMVNYKISVLGEVKSPGTFTVSNEKVNVLEALAMAGDMTVYGVRDNVKLVRETADGGRDIQELNLNDANLIRSPYFTSSRMTFCMSVPTRLPPATPISATVRPCGSVPLPF